MKKLLSSFLFFLILTSCTPGNPTLQANTTPTSPPKIIFPTAPPPCTDLIIEPTPGPDVPSVFPPVTNNDRVRGAQNPKLTIIGYVDYQDIRSAAFFKSVNQLLEENPDDVQIVSRPFPLIGVNDKAAIAAQAVEAAAEQDKGWEIHDLLYTQQANWIHLSVEDFERWIGAQVSALGLNVQQFEADLQREDIVARVQKDQEAAEKIGIPGTPLILVNGQIYGGPRDYNSFDTILKLLRLGDRQFESCPPMTVNKNKQYLATLHTEKGDVVIQLFADKAPVTVNSFLFLARNGWYDDTTFHRVIPELFAQTGDPSGTGKGNPGYYVITEFNAALRFDRPGVVAMVNSGPDTSGSQFFITYGVTPDFDGKFTIFGQVISGMDVLKQLTPRDPKLGSVTPPGNKLLDVTIAEQ